MGFRNSSAPNYRLTPASGDELTSQQELIVQAIDAGTYFHYNEIPSGAINGSNATFTLSANPNPDNSLLLTLGNILQVLDVDYTLSTVTITMIVAPEAGSILRAVYYVVTP